MKSVNEETMIVARGDLRLCSHLRGAEGGWLELGMPRPELEVECRRNLMSHVNT